MNENLLFELGCEELPSAAVWDLAQSLATNVNIELEKSGLQHAGIKTFSTPRRLAIYILHLSSRQSGQTISKRGPAVTMAYDADGMPTPALLGFAKSCGVEISNLGIIKTTKGSWINYETFTLGLPAIEIIPDILNRALNNLPIAKPMRWGANTTVFVRPVHWVVLLYGTEIVAANFFGIQSHRTTYGHRFLAPQAIILTHPDEYESCLAIAFVIADFVKRQHSITQQIKLLAAENHATVMISEKLAHEVTSIVEWPQALLGKFAADFLTIPQEVLATYIQMHQKCFPLYTNSDKLLPNFIMIANIHSQTYTTIIRGNEKVMAARLNDAAFFFMQDSKQTLLSRLPLTAKVIFQANLGTLYDKSIRLKKLLALLVTPLNLNIKFANRAAELSKCDLITGMVGEFPNLQGIMGYYYALQDNEPAEIALALREQYKPCFSGDNLPESSLGIGLSLVDRLDILIGIFSIKQQPSGVKDPFKCRRHAVAIVRILLANTAPLSLSTLLQQAVDIYYNSLDNKPSIASNTLIIELKIFIIERLQAYIEQNQAIRSDLIKAVLACQNDWFYDFDRRLKALLIFIEQPEASALSALCKRINNILQHDAAVNLEESVISADLLLNNCELQLFNKITELKNLIQPLMLQGKYLDILTQSVKIKPVVDDFFAKVLVIDKDPALCRNRLALLYSLYLLLRSVADFSVFQCT